MDKAQLMKGILEGCILKIIDQEETYGYEIVTRLQGLWIYGCERRHALSITASFGEKETNSRCL